MVVFIDTLDHFWWVLWKKFHNKLNFTRSYHPQTDGQIEFFNWTLSTMLQSLVGDTQENWELKLSQAEFAFNSMVIHTGKALFSIVYIKAPNHTTYLLKILDSKHKADKNLAEWIAKTIEEVCATLQHNMQYKHDVDAYKRFKTFNEGDLVMVHLHKHRFLVGTYSKLQPKKYGPFQIVSKINDNSYIIVIPSDWNISSTFNVSDIYDYFPEAEESCITTLACGQAFSNKRGADVGRPWVLHQLQAQTLIFCFLVQ